MRNHLEINLEYKYTDCERFFILAADRGNLMAPHFSDDDIYTSQKPGPASVRNTEVLFSHK